MFITYSYYNFVVSYFHILCNYKIFDIKEEKWNWTLKN